MWSLGLQPLVRLPLFTDTSFNSSWGHPVEPIRFPRTTDSLNKVRAKIACAPAFRSVSSLGVCTCVCMRVYVCVCVCVRLHVVYTDAGMCRGWMLTSGCLPQSILQFILLWQGLSLNSQLTDSAGRLTGEVRKLSLCPAPVLQTDSLLCLPFMLVLGIQTQTLMVQTTSTLHTESVPSQFSYLV